ncbi:hypothetical protein H8E07_14560 [bacterium]|nr:hypothetical protein [bacterium]
MKGRAEGVGGTEHVAAPPVEAIALFQRHPHVEPGPLPPVERQRGRGVRHQEVADVTRRTDVSDPSDLVQFGPSRSSRQIPWDGSDRRVPGRGEVR